MADPWCRPISWKIHGNTTTWRPARLDRARALAADGWTAREIATALGLTKNQVIGANRDHGIGLSSQSAAQRRLWRTRAPSLRPRDDSRILGADQINGGSA